MSEDKSNQINLHSKLNWTNEKFPAMASYTISNVLDIDGFDDFSYKRNNYHDRVDDDIFFLEKVQPFVHLISKKSAVFLNKTSTSKFINYYRHVQMRTSIARFEPEFYLNKDGENRLIFYLLRKRYKSAITQSHYFKYSVIVRCNLRNQSDFSEMIKLNYETSIKTFFYVTLFVGSNQPSNPTSYKKPLEINYESELVKYCIAKNSNIYNLLNENFCNSPSKNENVIMKESRFEDVRVLVRKKRRKMKRIK